MIYGYLGTIQTVLDRGAAQALRAEETWELGHHLHVFGKAQEEDRISLKLK